MSLSVSFLGHASMLISGRDGTVLLDPLLLPAHHEGLYDVYPPRRLDLDRLPAFDAVVVSHGHLDHFDLDSLDLIPRTLPIFVPAEDRLLQGCLQGLGFQRVHTMRSFAPFQVGSLRFIPTPGADGVLDEHGLLVVEEGATLWNLIDTFPSPAAIARVKADHPRIDLAIVPWQPLQDTELQSGRPVSFPYGVYAEVLQNILQIDARALVAGACGYAAQAGAEFTNHVMFPVTRPRFMEDITRANPEWRGRVFSADPGDRLELDGEELRHQTAALDYCRAEPYRWEDLAYRPMDLGAPVSEPDPAFSAAAAGEFARAFLEESLPEGVAASAELYAWHRRWAVRQEVEVVFNDQRRHWLLDFSGPQLVVRPGRSPLATASTVIAASTLAGLVAQQVTWDFALLSARYRHHQHSYLVDGTGLKAPPPGRLADPVRLLLTGAGARERALTARVVSLRTRAALAGEDELPWVPGADHASLHGAAMEEERT